MWPVCLSVCARLAIHAYRAPATECFPALLYARGVFCLHVLSQCEFCIACDLVMSKVLSLQSGMASLPMCWASLAVSLSAIIFRSGMTSLPSGSRARLVVSLSDVAGNKHIK